MWKFIIILAAVYILFRLFKNDILHKQKENAVSEQQDMDEKIAAGTMVKDPECGTYVSVDGNITVRDGETVHHFCSYECREKFLNRLRDAGRQIPPLGE
ncbi:MAG: transcriptional regulator [Desulfovibrio sp.]|nr:transcriptional regulator [Desulfovibrio sp.]